MFIQYIYFKVRIFKKINRKFFFLDKKIKQKKLKNPKNNKKPPKNKYKNQTKKKKLISVYV